MGMAGIALCIALGGVKALGAQKLQHRIRSSIYQNAYRHLIYAGQEGRSLGEVTNQLSNHTTELVNAVNRFVVKVSSDACCYVFASVTLATIRPALAAIIVGVSLLPVFFIQTLSGREQEDRRQYMEELERVNQTAAGGLYSIESVKANAMEEPFSARYASALERLCQRRKALTKTVTRLTLPSVFCAFFMQFTIVISSGWFAATGRISAGEMVTIIALMSFIVDPVMCLENTIVALHSFRVSLTSLRDYLTKEPCATAPAAPAAPVAPVADDRVVFKDVSFCYPSGKDVLHGLSLSLSPGKIHVLRGENGAGKSTLVRLLCGALQPQKGRIFVLGQDAARLQPWDYESLISVMPQESVMLAGTIMENLLLCRPDATREQAIEACRQAEIHEDIAALAEGYDTVLSEGGGTFSGGQKQRIAFARTLLRDAPVMIFDEPSAALDDARCARMRGVLERLSRDRIVLLITHDARMLGENDDVLELGRQR